MTTCFIVWKSACLPPPTFTVCGPISTVKLRYADSSAALSLDSYGTHCVPEYQAHLTWAGSADARDVGEGGDCNWLKSCCARTLPGSFSSAFWSEEIAAALFWLFMYCSPIFT